ncbi:MAG: tetratricopeptide repeat protein [Culturomica sp.]|jgi:tetratricopeptide (TPR) repeat protein|nr:tetratricopeptide repeat protein [Culturomica sp.]
MKRIFCILFLSVCLTAGAQQSDSQLAFNYYQNKEYVKAAELFLQLYERTKSAQYLDYHVISLINAKEYEKAEEVLKKYLKTDGKNRDFLINLGFIYDQQGNRKKADDYFEDAFKTLANNRNDIVVLANKFRNIREYGWAIRTYRKGRELLKNPSEFIIEMGDNYLMDRDFDNMFRLYAEGLESNPGLLNNVTSMLGYSRSYDVNGNADNVIRNGLQKIFEREAYPPVFDELGIWYALQTKGYDEAFRHALRLNRLQPDKIYTYQNIAQEAFRAKEYETAIRSWQQLLNQEKDNPYYLTARREILRSQYALERSRPGEPARFTALAGESEAFLAWNGYTPVNIEILLMLSDLYAYELNLPDSANRVLEKGIAIRNLDAPRQNLLKSKRADLLAYMDRTWEAVILYTQIEKANPNNDTGYEAKLKKAFLAYYAGDLEWARAQFDALKGSTTKLTANDAIRMSHFINMHYDGEEEDPALQELARTEFLVYRGKTAEAMPKLDSLTGLSDRPEISDYAVLIKANLLQSLFRPEEAEALFEKLRTNSTETFIQAEALFRLAGLEAERGNLPQSLRHYRELVSEYPGSVYSVEAGKRYRELEKEIP